VGTSLFRITLAALSPTTPYVGRTDFRRASPRMPLDALSLSSFASFRKQQAFVWTNEMWPNEVRQGAWCLHKQSIRLPVPALCCAMPRLRPNKFDEWGSWINFDDLWYVSLYKDVTSEHLRWSDAFFKNHQSWILTKAFGETRSFQCNLAPKPCKLLQCAAKSHASRPSRAHTVCFRRTTKAAELWSSFGDNLLVFQTRKVVSNMVKFARSSGFGPCSLFTI
jgi:hypothetical protein